jgi:hypothetical protein
MLVCSLEFIHVASPLAVASEKEHEKYCLSTAWRALRDFVLVAILIRLILNVTLCCKLQTVINRIAYGPFTTVVPIEA